MLSLKASSVQQKNSSSNFYLSFLISKYLYRIMILRIPNYAIRTVHHLPQYQCIFHQMNWLHLHFLIFGMVRFQILNHPFFSLIPIMLFYILSNFFAFSFTRMRDIAIHYTSSKERLQIGYSEFSASWLFSLYNTSFCSSSISLINSFHCFSIL